MIERSIQSLKDQIAPIDLFKRLMRDIRSQSIFFKDWTDQKIEDQKIEDQKIEFPTLPTGTMIRVGNLIGSIIFCDQKINSIMKQIDLLTIDLFKDQRDQYAHSWSC